MRPLRYSINVTLDGCRDHRAIAAVTPAEQLKQEPGTGLYVGGVQLSLAFG
jgi:hypothetical protein